MTKVFNTLISDQYCPDWTPENGVREFISNALDSKAPFIYSWEEEKDGTYTLELTSKNTKLPTKCLALGVSENRNDSNAVGTHGEGMVVSMAVLLREGIELSISNGEDLWLPALVHSEDFGCSMLVITETPGAAVGNGDFIVRISGLSDDQKANIIHNCLYLQKDLGKVVKCSKGDILYDRPGELYVGGVFVTDTQMKYGYDFHPSALKLNRDRKSVDGWDLEWEVARLWAQDGDAKEVAQMVYDDILDVCKMKYIAVSCDVADACVDIYREKYKGAPIASDSVHEEELKELGVEGIRVTGKECFTRLVREHKDYSETQVHKEEEPSPLQLLEDVYNLLSEQLEKAQLVQLEALIGIYEEKGVAWESQAVKATTMRRYPF